MPTPPDQPNDPGTSAPVPKDPQDVPLDRLIVSVEGLVESLNKREERQAEAEEKSKKRAATAAKNATSRQSSFFKELGNKLSLALPGGARLFGLGTLMDKFKDFDERAEKGYTNKGKGGALTSFGAAIRKVTLGMGAAAAAAYALEASMRGLGKRLGVGTGDALGDVLGIAKTQITGWMGIGTDGTGPRFGRSPVQTFQAQEAASLEFGVLIEPQTAALLGDLATDLGLSTRDLISLERVFQSSTISSSKAINKFKTLGMTANVAQKELVKNADAVARAGDQFNTYIAASIVNAKRLGLEFKNMDQTLTGYTMDFEGTIGKFAELRAVLPGFQVNFGQLMSTAMSGTTDEFIEIIRGGMLGAGLSPNDPRNRLVAQLLKDATGFSSDQVDRILGNATPFQDEVQDLDKTRNSLLKYQAGILGAVLGMLSSTFGAVSSLVGLVAGLLPAGKALKPMGFLGKALGSATVRGVAGAAVGYGAAGMMMSDDDMARIEGSVNDAYITKQGKVYDINPNDNALFTQQSPFGGSNQVIEKKLDKIGVQLGNLASAMMASKTVTMKGFTEAIETVQAAAIHDGF